MKKNKFILFSLLVGFLITNSCSDRSDKKDVDDEQKQLVEKEKAIFSFKINKLPEKVILNNIPLEIEYSYEESAQQNHNYQLKFEFEEDKNHNATLNGHKPREWFNIHEKTGKLYYKPLSAGNHKVKITSKNDARIEKTVSFTIISNTKLPDPVISGLSFDKLELHGDRFIENGNIWKQSGHYVSLKLRFDVIPYSQKPSLKGRLRMPDLGGIDHSFECPPPAKPNGFSKCVYEIIFFYIPDDLYVDDKQEFKYEIEVENAEGNKAHIRASKKPELKYHNYP